MLCHLLTKLELTASASMAQRLTDDCVSQWVNALFILGLFCQSTSTYFGHICRPSSGDILYIYIHTYIHIYIYKYNNWFVLCFSVDYLLAGQQIVTWKAQHVPIVVYIQYNSWWWATNMPETCRGLLCIKLVFITQMYRDTQSTKYKKNLFVSVCLISHSNTEHLIQNTNNSKSQT